MRPAADSEMYSLEKFTLYETRARFYVVGRDKTREHWRVLKIDRSEPSELNLSEDPVSYTQQECMALLKRVAEGNKSTGGLTAVTKAYGIVGFVSFMESYYMILVTKRRQVGRLCGQAIYGIEEKQLITVPHATVQSDLASSKTEQRYKKLLSGVDLTKDFFFSYTYKLMCCLQRNVLENTPQDVLYDNMFVWNAFLTRGIRQRLNSTRWTVALIHGSFQQQKLSVFGRIFVITLIGRRSRHFAGTRYLKRGVNDDGRVANDVETEQIVLDEESELVSPFGHMSSVVQNRGSIPLFWSQEASRLSPKPDIILQRYDPIYEATRLHFQDLARRYSNPIIILNLIKTVEKRPREMMLRREFANAVAYLNQILDEEKRLKFIHWDFHKFAKSKAANVLAVLDAVAGEALDLTGIFYTGKVCTSKHRMQQHRMATHAKGGCLGRNAGAYTVDGPTNLSGMDDSSLSSSFSNSSGTRMDIEREQDHFPEGREPKYQVGVLRTNCIDCLDRTNVAQYAYGLAALGRQLYALQLTDVQRVDPDSDVAAALMVMYQNMGDCLALQYGGSAAHNTVFPERQGKWKATTQSQEFIKSIKRYYSNTYTDGEKQDAMNLFLGHFQPREGKPALWELDSDYYLHVGGNRDDYPREQRFGTAQEQAVHSDHSSLPGIPTTIPYGEDFQRLKLTSFDKLLQMTSGTIKPVRMFSSDLQLKTRTPAGVSGTDATEVQLKSPNWLFGQRKFEEPGPASPRELTQTGSPKPVVDRMSPQFDWLLSPAFPYVEDMHMIVSGNPKQYSDMLFAGSLEDGEACVHYAQYCQGSFDSLDLHAEDIKNDLKNVIDVVEATDDVVVAAMEAALQVDKELGEDLTMPGTWDQPQSQVVLNMMR